MGDAFSALRLSSIQFNLTWEGSTGRSAANVTEQVSLRGDSSRNVKRRFVQ